MRSAMQLTDLKFAARLMGHMWKVIITVLSCVCYFFLFNTVFCIKYTHNHANKYLFEILQQNTRILLRHSVF
jgi:hypothetical protein